MNHTQNLSLPQWEADDFIHHDDFNDAMAALDAAVTRIAAGSYIGTGEYGAQHPNTLTFPFRPKVVFLYFGSDYDRGVIMLTRDMTEIEVPGSTVSYATFFVTWGDNSVSWYATLNEKEQMNRAIAGRPYYYVALG